MSGPQVCRLFRFIDGNDKPRPAVLICESEGRFLRVSFTDAETKNKLDVPIWPSGKRLGPKYFLDKDSKVSVHFVKLISTQDYEHELAHELGLCDNLVLHEMRCILIAFRKYLDPPARAVIEAYLAKWIQKCPDLDAASSHPTN